MFSIALVGPDGVGKTTISNHLKKSFPLPVKSIYMGLNREASNYSLPTTQWWEKLKNKRIREKKYSSELNTKTSQNKFRSKIKLYGRIVKSIFGLINLVPLTDQFKEIFRQGAS